jgi:hypothetical protein
VDENPTPVPETASGPPLGEAPGAGVTPDAGLGEVVAWFEEQGSDLEQILGDVLRQAVDEVLDGQRTGRYDIDQLAKTEKTYLGTKVEIMCESEFGFPRGKHMDYLISGHEVDCKFTLRFGGWAIPREAVGQICLLLHADDKHSRFSAGVVRAFPEALSAGTNRDGKKRLSLAGRSAVHWFVRDGALPENLLLALGPATRDAIFHGGAGLRDSGQARVTRLFRLVQGRIVRREVVLAVGRQADAPKRVRDARLQLRAEGVLVLGHQGLIHRSPGTLDYPSRPRGRG